MKSVGKMLVGLAICMIVITGCPSPNGNTSTKKPVTDFTIMDGATEIADNDEITIEKDEAKTLNVSLLPAGVSGTVTWKSSDTGIVSVSPSTGLTSILMGGGGGISIITITAYNDDNASPVVKKFTVTVTVKKPVTGITIMDGSQEVANPLAINEGAQRNLSVNLIPEGVAGATVTWASDNAAVTVSPDTGTSATVTGVTKGGSAAITVTAHNADNTTPVTKTLTVKVNEDDVPLKPVTGITILDGGTEIAANTEITIEKNVAKTLSVSLVPADVQGASVTWVSSDNTTVSFSAANTLATTLTGLAAGTATITVTAQNADNVTPVTTTFTVKVEDVAVDPNLLWQWKSADTPWPGLNSGATPFKAPGFDGTNGTKLISVRAFGATIPAGTGGGIKLGAAASDNAGRLAIGQAANTGTTDKDTTTTIGGDFDLSSSLVKVTVDYTGLVSYGNRYVFRLSVNNNTTTAANSSLGSSSEIVAYDGPTSTRTNPKLTETSGTITVVIDPSKFAGNAKKDALKQAFIGLHCQNADTAGENNEITLTAIKIERIESGSLDLVVSHEDNFAGFPAGEITLSKTSAGGHSSTATITLTGTYDSVKWYLDGEEQTSTGSPYTLDSAGLSAKKHSLAVVVAKGGTLYSKTVPISVIE